MLLFAITFFSDIIFLFKFYSIKRRTKRLKLCEKKGRHTRLGESNLSIIWPTYPRTSVQEIMHSSNVQCNTKESP